MEAGNEWRRAVVGYEKIEGEAFGSSNQLKKSLKKKDDCHIGYYKVGYVQNIKIVLLPIESMGTVM